VFTIPECLPNSIKWPLSVKHTAIVQQWEHNIKSEQKNAVKHSTFTNKTNGRKVCLSDKDHFIEFGAVLGLLHPVAGGVLHRGLKFRTCTNNLNNFF
jgi:hypothetical protein